VGKRKKKIAQHNVAVMFPTVNIFNDDKYALQFIDGIMTYGMSSRLFTSVRERLGLVYSIKGGLELCDIGGFYYISFSCTPNNTQKVLATIKSEVERLLSDGVTEEEVQKVKNIKRAHRLFEAEDVEETNQRNVEQLSELGKIETTEQYLAKIDKIKPADVLAAARKYLDIQNASICVVGGKIKALAL
jgi:predicted Zn-dependent peptidase